MSETTATSAVFADATQMAGTGEVMIELIGVQKFFGTFQALRDIDLNVARQEVVVVIGPSGSGKSTMIRCINRLEEHDGGRIVVDGVELTRDIRNIQEIRRETGMVFQQFNLFPHLTVLDNITLAPRQVRKVPQARGRGAGDGAARAGADPRAGQEVPGPAVGRPAAARGDRPGAGDEAEGDAVRRADVGARPGDDQRGARRDEGPRRAKG